MRAFIRRKALVIRRFERSFVFAGILSFSKKYGIDTDGIRTVMQRAAKHLAWDSISRKRARCCALHDGYLNYES
jgi:hypothetical protein